MSDCEHRTTVETGQYYYRARMYSPQQGRFLSNDPLGMVDGPNMYMYVRNDPINARDPSGRWNPGWGNPMLYNGAAGAPDDLSTCPNDPTFETYWDCLSYAVTLPLDAAEACHARCFGERWGGGSVLPIQLDQNKYEECLLEEFTEKAHKIAAGCIVGVMLVSVLVPILGTNLAGMLAAGPAGAAAAAASSAATLTYILAPCIAGVSLALMAQITWCGVKSLYFSW